jgi:ankyrin repeat protein
MKPINLFCLLLALMLTALGCGAKLSNSIEPASWLYVAAANGDIEEAQLLIARGADVSAKEAYLGQTPLHWATNKDVAELLIVKGADVNAKVFSNGSTPLHRAAVDGHKDVAELLIAKGADVNIKDNLCRTPLEVAKEQEYKEIVELLQKHGANE